MTIFPAPSGIFSLRPGICPCRVFGANASQASRKADGPHWLSGPRRLAGVALIVMAAASLGMVGNGIAGEGAADEGAAFNYLIGVGSEDVTGPAVGVQMFGFVREDQISEGIHLRQRARTFIVAERDGSRRLVLCVVDLGSVTHEITRSVLDRLRERYGDVYGLANVVISATHTHAAPGGFWHHGANTPLGGPLYGEYFDAIVDGITASIVKAHESLRPGQVLISTGMVENAGAQRSAPAYQNNPEAERKRYAADTDKQMTLLKFVDAHGPIGTINWFAVHPTSMTYYNRLISTDNKGYAEWAFERQQQAAGRVVVAAFAQSNCGDVTPNLNLDNTGPGKDEFESTRIIGERQLERAIELYDMATTALSGPIDYRHQYVDFSTLEVDDRFTGAGKRHTCPSAYGYAFAAGSTEDGGGHPLFKEGMKERNPFIDSLARQLVPLPPPSDALRQCHLPKAILFAPGAAKPPAQPQRQPIGLARVGSLVLVIGPAEFTTMTGRRIREAVAAALGPTARHVVIAGFANGYAGYVTTREEYETQQYEGGHTLYGPWTEAGYRQQFVRLAEAMASGKPAPPGKAPRDVRGEVERASLATPYDEPPRDAEFGEVVSDAKAEYRVGQQVRVVFWTGNPRNGYDRNDHFLSIERKTPDGWLAVASDADWSTKCRFLQPETDDDGTTGDTTADNAATDGAAARAAPTGEAARGDAASAKVPKNDRAGGKKSSTKKPGAARGGSPQQATKPMRLDAFHAIITWDIPPETAAGTYRVVHFGRFKSKGDGKLHRFEVSSRPFQVRP